MRQMTSIQLRDILGMGINLTLLDVREMSELQYGTLKNSIHIPMGTITEKMNELEHLKKTPIVIILPFR